jgi:hypothetical protein
MASSESALDPEIQEKAPPIEARTELGTEHFAREQKSETANREDLGRNFYSEVIKRSLPTAAASGEPDGDLRAALRAVKGRRLLDKLLKEEEETKLKASRKGAAGRSRERIDSPIPTLTYLRSMKSISQRDAADYLRRSERTVRNYARDRKLNLTHKSRVVCDDKLFRLLRKFHGDAVLG